MRRRNHLYWSASSTWNGQLPLGEIKDVRRIARAITNAEEGIESNEIIAKSNAPVLEITGTGGSGKSSVTDEIVKKIFTCFSIQLRLQ